MISRSKQRRKHKGIWYSILQKIIKERKKKIIEKNTNDLIQTFGLKIVIDVLDDQNKMK